MIVEIVRPSCAVQVSEFIGNRLVTKTYYGYTKREAIREFKRETRETRK